MKTKITLAMLLAIALCACDEIERKLATTENESAETKSIAYQYVPTLGPDGLWITNSRTGSTTHCKLSGDMVQCAAFVSGAGEEPHFRYDPATEKAVPLNEAARISQIYEKYGLEPSITSNDGPPQTASAKKPEDMTDQELLDELRNQLVVGDIRDCKQFVGRDSSKEENWVPLPKDSAGVCVPPPAGYVLSRPK